MKRTMDLGNALVIAFTVILFVFALFVKGITKDLLLEAGVLLVSIKLIMMNYKNSMSNQELLKKMERIEKALSEINNK